MNFTQTVPAWLFSVNLLLLLLALFNNYHRTHLLEKKVKAIKYESRQTIHDTLPEMVKSDIRTVYVVVNNINTSITFEDFYLSDTHLLKELDGDLCFYDRAIPAEIIAKYPKESWVKYYTSDVDMSGKTLKGIKR